MIDLGTGNNNKINWAIEDKQEFIDIVGKLSNHSLMGHLRVVSVAEAFCSKREIYSAV